MLNFEYDQKKSELNETKHGISFEEAKKLWDDLNAVKLEAIERSEIRYLLIAKLYKKHWSAIYTYRGEKIRIISVRRSRKNEVLVYESN